MGRIQKTFYLILLLIINIIYLLTVFLIKISLFGQINFGKKPFSIIKKITMFLTKMSGVISFRTPLVIFSWFGNDIRLSVIDFIIRPYFLILLDRINFFTKLNNINFKINV